MTRSATPVLARVRRALAPVLLVLAAPSLALAQAGYDADALGREGFVPAESVLPGDQVPGGALMLGAYIVFFALIGLYVFRLVREQRRVAADVVELRDRLEALDDRLAQDTEPPAG